MRNTLQQMRKLAILFFISLISIGVNAEKFSYHTKSVTTVQNGRDVNTQPKNIVIVVNTDNSTVSIDGKIYKIVSSAWGNYPETYFYVSGNNNQKFLILIDYKYNFFIIDYRNGNAHKFKFQDSSISDSNGFLPIKREDYDKSGKHIIVVENGLGKDSIITIEPLKRERFGRK